MGRRTAWFLAWSLWGLFACLQVARVWQVWEHADTGDTLFGLVVFGYATVGALIASYRPGNAVGWLLLAVALAFAIQIFGEGYLLNSSRPGHVAVAWVAGWIWYVWFLPLCIFLPLLFPDGRLLTRRWRPVAWIGIAGVATSVLSAAFKPGALDVNVAVTNPLGVDGTSEQMRSVLEVLSVGLSLVAFLLAATSLTMRFRRARGVERQRLKWFAYVGLVMLTAVSTAAVSEMLPPAGWVRIIGGVGWFTFLVTAFFGLPAAIGFAVLRYRLYDVDVVINKTLVYGALTAALAAVYLGSVLALRLVLDPLIGESDLAVAGSTLAVAGMFRPARTRIQALVDRRFYRHRYDAAQIVGAFSARLRDELDVEALSADLRAVVSSTVQPMHVGLWLRKSPP